MFYHNDLNLYKNPNFRSYEYLKNIWNILEFDLVFIVGMINNGNITINIESDFMQITVTSNFKNIFNKNYEIDFSHSLTLCYDFVLDITINLINTVKEFYFDVENCRFYYDKENSSDEGFVEFIVFSNVKISNLDKFKISFFSFLSKELQFVINKNVFLLDIEKNDIIESDIDALFEQAQTLSVLKETSLDDEIKNLKIQQEDKDLITQLKKELDET